MSAHGHGHPPNFTFFSFPSCEIYQKVFSASEMDMYIVEVLQTKEFADLTVRSQTTCLDRSNRRRITSV